MGKRIGKRLGGETNQPKEKKKSRLTGFQKFLLVICILLALALAAVFAWKKTFVRPELPDKSQTTVTNPETGEVEEEVIDYGDGIRPKVDGKRKSQVEGRKITFWVDTEQVEVDGSVITVDVGNGDVKDSAKRFLGN